jgi:hypothetical protein
MLTEELGFFMNIPDMPTQKLTKKQISKKENYIYSCNQYHHIFKRSFELKEALKFSSNYNSNKNSLFNSSSNNKTSNREFGNTNINNDKTLQLCPGFSIKMNQNDLNNKNFIEKEVLEQENEDTPENFGPGNCGFSSYNSLSTNN